MNPVELPHTPAGRLPFWLKPVPVRRRGRPKLWKAGRFAHHLRHLTREHAEGVLRYRNRGGIVLGWR